MLLAIIWKSMRVHSVSDKRKWVRLTRVCNNHCIFCLDEKAQDGTFLPLEIIEQSLKDGIKEKCSRVVLSGGDPTVHPDFLKIIRMAKDIGYGHIQTITNGRMFCYSNFLHEAVKEGLSEITFSIHAPNVQINDLLTGVKGSFIQSMTALRSALSIKNLIVNCDIVVSKLNVDCLFEHINMLYSFGVREFDILHIMPFGRAWTNWKQLYYDPFEKKNQLLKVFDIGRRPGVHLWTNRFPPELFDGRENLIQSPDKLMYEVMGRSKPIEDWRNNGKTMECSGERCNYCVLKGFCRDFANLLEYGKLEALPVPECLKGKRHFIPKNNSKKLIKAGDPLDKIASFYIYRRYFFKSSRCSVCKYHDSCSGASLFHVIKNGFSSLVPVN